MSFDTYIADRIRNYFNDKHVIFEEKNMMGGLCFMVDSKMACGIHFDKKKQIDLLMVRIGEEAQKKHQNHQGCMPMDFTGRVMKGYLFVSGEGFDNDDNLYFWLQLCLDFNLIA